MHQFKLETQYGIVCLSSIDDYENKTIKKHENILFERFEERANLCYAQNANVSPVFLTFLGGENIENKIMEIVQTESFSGSCTSSDGVTHNLWL